MYIHYSTFSKAELTGLTEIHSIKVQCLQVFIMQQLLEQILSLVVEGVILEQVVLGLSHVVVGEDQALGVHVEESGVAVDLVGWQCIVEGAEGSAVWHNACNGPRQQ